MLNKIDIKEKTSKNSSRVGEVSYNKNGSKMTIIEYNNCFDMVVKFDDGIIAENVKYDSFKKGKVKNPYDKTVHNIGYIGEGIYEANNENKAYQTWLNMMARCYSEKYHNTFPTYIGCTVCDEWHNYQVFCKWFHENYYTIENNRMEIDKDILIKGNKIYSPETCIFVPHFINTLFIKCDAHRGDLPCGVNVSPSGKYFSKCSNIYDKKPIRLGLFDSPTEAFNAYKKYKEKLIQDIAYEYVDKIPQRLYDALCAYEVEITD